MVIMSSWNVIQIDKCTSILYGFDESGAQVIFGSIFLWCLLMTYWYIPKVRGPWATFKDGFAKHERETFVCKVLQM